jgi:hypothetical protein
LKEGALLTGKSLKETQFLKKIAFKKEGDGLSQLANAISSTTQNTNTTNTEQ